MTGQFQLPVAAATMVCGTAKTSVGRLRAWMPNVRCHACKTVCFGRVSKNRAWYVRGGKDPVVGTKTILHHCTDRGGVPTHVLPDGCPMAARWLSAHVRSGEGLQASGWR